MAENIDLAKTFAELGGTTLPGVRPTGATRSWSSTTALI
jgi:hypothetical protein